MTVEECYAGMRADYRGVLSRLGNEDRVKRFLLKLPQDDSFRLLCDSFGAGDAQEAFRAAHSMKGICMNLGLTALSASSAALADELRGGEMTEAAAPLYEKVCGDYRSAVACIGELARD